MASEFKVRAKAFELTQQWFQGYSSQLGSPWIPTLEQFDERLAATYNFLVGKT